MTTGPLSRRAVIAGIAGLAAYGLPVPAAAAYLRNVSSRQQEFQIRPRSDWAGEARPPRFALETEDVRLLVVHHTLIPGNSYREDQVAKLLRDIYDFHTGPEKGWADTAYNFMVDQFGGIWETREGSIAGPVVGSATGGNQGFTQLCCFLGDLSNQPPTEAATASMAWLLGTLADRYEIDTEPGATVTATSRGSSRFASGTEMTLSTLAGHRDVSLTACPGDTGYAFLQNTLPALVNASRTSLVTTTLPPTTEAPTTTAAPTTPAPTTEAPSTSAATSAAPSTAAAAAVENSTVDPASDLSAQGELENTSPTNSNAIPVAVGGAAVVAAGLGILAVAKRSGQEDHEPTVAAPDTRTQQSNPTDPALHDDGSVNVPARLGLTPTASPTRKKGASELEVPAALRKGGAVAVATPEAAPKVLPGALPPLPGPQRVWWAVEGGASIDTERAVEELSREIHGLAISSRTDEESDRREWSRVDALLTKRSDKATSSIVAARSDAVYVLRSEPCLVIVTRPDGVEKRDFGEAALSVARGDVARIAVHFGDESDYPDIEVTAG